MLNIFSQLVAEQARAQLHAALAASAPRKSADPDGLALARLLFALPDPLDIELPARKMGLYPPRVFDGVKTPRSREEERASARASSELVFVAAPASMRKLREAGVILKDASGADVAVFEGCQIPFGGYADDVSFDERHWGLELRRFGPERQRARMTHALRETAPERFDQDESVAPARAAAAKSRL